MTPTSYEDIRNFIKTSVAHRDTAGLPDFLTPSTYWKYFISHFEYLSQLSDSELKRIRYHTYHLTGDCYTSYTHQPVATFKPLREEYHTLVQETGGYVAGEGELGFGHEIGDQKVTVDTVRYMQVIADLHRTNVLQRNGRISVLEIGGGYGGLARSVMNYQPQASYVICDLEETMFFQAVHLSNNFGFSSVELCPNGISPNQVLEPGRFYLIPQHQADSISAISLDLVVNQQSLQEMTPDQIRHYFAIIEKSATNFYSCNSQHDPSVTDKLQVVTRLEAMLDEKFPKVKWQSRAGSATKTVRRAGKLFRLLLGKPIRRVGDYDLRRVLYRTGRAS